MRIGNARTLYFVWSSFDKGADIIIRLAVESAWKWALRHLLRSLLTPAARYFMVMINEKYNFDVGEIWRNTAGFQSNRRILVQSTTFKIPSMRAVRVGHGKSNGKKKNHGWGQEHKK